MDSEQRKKIAIEIYEQTGVMYDEKDPVFALAIIAGQVQKNLIKDLEEDYRSLNLSINQLPDQLSASLEKLAVGVEEAEKSYEEIAIRHQAVINQQLDEAKINLRNRITAEVAESMRDAHLQLNQLSRKIEAVNKQSSFTNSKSWLAVLVMAFVTFLSVSGLVFVILKGG